MTLLDGTVIPVRRGLRAWFGRGRHHIRRHRIGHLATGLVLMGAVHLH